MFRVFISYRDEDEKNLTQKFAKYILVSIHAISQTLYSHKPIIFQCYAHPVFLELNCINYEEPKPNI